MSTKRFVVREGYNFRRVREIERKDGQIERVEDVSHPGDIVTLEEAEGLGYHQLEYADEADRVAAEKAERKAAAKAPAATIFDPEGLAAAITNGLVRAMTMQTSAQSGAGEGGGIGGGGKGGGAAPAGT